MHNNTVEKKVYHPDEVLSASEIKEDNEQSKGKKDIIIAWGCMFAALFYMALPIDLVPDVPVIGWFDDLLFILGTSLNLTEKYTGRQNPVIAKMIKYLKWGVIFLGLLIVIVTLIFGAIVWKIFFSGCSLSV